MNQRVLDAMNWTIAFLYHHGELEKAELIRDAIRQIRDPSPLDRPSVEPLMADGKTKLSDYLEDNTPDDQIMDEWTKGYNECKRRLFKIVGHQLRALDRSSDSLLLEAMRDLYHNGHLIHFMHDTDEDRRIKTNAIIALEAAEKAALDHPSDAQEPK
jgi:hypothetical protein